MQCSQHSTALITLTNWAHKPNIYQNAFWIILRFSFEIIQFKFLLTKNLDNMFNYFKTFLTWLHVKIWMTLVLLIMETTIVECCSGCIYQFRNHDHVHNDRIRAMTTFIEQCWSARLSAPNYSDSSSFNLGVLYSGTRIFSFKE